MLKKTFLSLSILIASISSFAQDIGSYIQEQQVIPFQKLYLHTDRDFYFYGDTLWFASYLVDGQTHAPSSENCNLYVELINTKGEITQKAMFPIENGICPGFLSFSNNGFIEGNYLLRAYTDYLKNFGDDSFFEKTIKLSETKNSAELSDSSSLTSDLSKIDIQFFPEGGFLLADKKNLVAFKAINEKGQPTEINGKITDKKGKFICSLKSLFKGMGTFNFIPTERSIYNVKIEGHPELDLKLPEVQTKGSKVIITKADNDVVRFKIVTSEEKTKKPFFIALMHRGKETFFLELGASQINKNIQVKTDSLKNGINRVVLLNSNLEPLSERLVFINHKNELSLKVEPNQSQFKTREKVTLQINSHLLIGKEYANLSLAVVNENALNTEGNPQNIKSYLLIDSELKGHIPTPADFFIDDEKNSSESKLDLLMLTNGWKNYIWNNLKTEENSIQFAPQLGVTLRGKVLAQNGKKTVDNAKVILNVKSKNLAGLYSTTPDNKGNYEFNNILIYDTATVFLQGKNKRSKNRTYLELDSFNYSAPIHPEKTKFLNYYSAIPISLYRLNYFNNRAIKEFYPDRNTRVLEDVVVNAEKPEEPDGHHRIYEKPKASFEINEKDVSYNNIFEYLRIRVPGVRVFGDRIHGYRITIGPPNGADPLFLINGMRTNTGTLRFLNMAEVDNIEILKRNEATIYGARGAGGVLSVWTKKGEIRDPESIVVPGTIVKKIQGFAPFREFYSPKYTLENIESEEPDLRTTLYWNPKVTLENGKAEVSFYTCDIVARYKIFIEGITSNGEICLGNAEFEVNEKRNKQDKL